MLAINHDYSRDEHIVMAMVASAYIQEAIDRKRRYLDIDASNMSEEFTESYSLLKRFESNYLEEDLNKLFCYYAHPDVYLNATDEITWITENEGNRFGYINERSNVYVFSGPYIPVGANLGCLRMGAEF